MRTILLLLTLSLLAGCVGVDDGFSRVEASEVEREADVMDGNSQFLAILGQSDDTPTEGDTISLYLISDGAPPPDPVGSFGYVVCEVADIMNEFAIVSGDQDLLADEVGVVDAFDGAVDAYDIEQPVVTAVQWTASLDMNDGEHMLVDYWGSDFRFDIAILPID